MQISLSDLELAIAFASSDDAFACKAYLNSETGEIYFTGDLVDEELPEDIYENPKYLLIPSKRELELGKPLVLSFVAEEMPDQIDNVYSMFRSRGAYSRFKSLLLRLNRLEKWYDYENSAIRDAAIEWCQENSMECDKNS